jgi:tRNA threonylcarbamoyladenosine modification (KEOPS) complex  Pcc1 subunit
MKVQAVVRLKIISEKQFQVVMNALKPETETSSTPRSKVNLKTEDQNLVLEFMARDTSALRAAMNSYLRLIGVAIKLQKIIE